MKDPKIYLNHIMEAIYKIEIAAQDFSNSNSFLDEKLWMNREVILRQLEIIGEASKNLPEEFKRNHTYIPWTQIAGMRNYIIHEYFAINYERVWNTVQSDIPHLKEQIKTLLEQ